MNESLSMIYYLKEELCSLCEEEELEQAQGKLMDLIVFVESTQLPLLINFAKTLRKHVWNISDWYDCPITTGRLEGINNKIKTLKRQAYRFNDMEYFKLKILAFSRS